MTISATKALYSDVEISMTSMETSTDLPPLLLGNKIAGKASIAMSSSIKFDALSMIVEDHTNARGGTIRVVVIHADIFA